MNRFFTSLILLFCLHSLTAQEFRHPGILHSEEALQRITRLVETQSYPAIGSYQKLRADRKSSFRYAMQGPFRDISRSGKYAYTKTPCEEDFNAAYYNALMWQITRDTRHADKAMEILRTYATTLTKVHPIDTAYRAGEQSPAFLLHSTGHHPAGSEIDYAIVYADYYYIEALLRLKQLNQQ